MASNCARGAYMKIAIVDDEKIYREQIKLAISKVYGDEEFSICEYESGESLLSSCELENCDILFLDIEMGGLNGFETAKLAKETNENITLIFATSHDEMVFSSFSLSPFRFIRKSHFEGELKPAVADAKEKIAFETRSVAFETKTGIVNLKISEIQYFEVFGHTVSVVATSGIFAIKSNLTALENQFAIYGFVRCHKSFIVNVNHIFSINQTSITLVCKDELPLSRRKTEEVKQTFLKFLR